ncbi:hypothetical protein GGR51DRAFT_172309 [Nemania sp. FL0031]|nr:hypothetical protein GGR51DRAFT_172309 [Nemania sp. FL0031]
MAISTQHPKKALAAHMRRVYHPIGFSKGYNFVLWCIFAGTFFGFALARLKYLDFWGVFCNPDRQAATGALPGECYYFTKPGRYQIGIILHLATILPASLLACVQFVPVVRRKAIFVHRVNGYVVNFLAVVGTSGALMIARHSAGGGVDVQTLVGLLAILWLGAMALSMINIWRLQIEQHRAWMIRAWAYGAIIITMRIGLFVGALVVSSIGGYYMAQPCDKINFALKGEDTTMAFYPQCAPFFSGENPDQQAVIKANIYGDNSMEAGAALNLAFGPAAWLALVLHAIGAELYLRLTPAEHERLRNVSYYRQLRAGMKNPGSAGLTADRLGDAHKWAPKVMAKKISYDGESVKGERPTSPSL